ncbi:MAG: hypothetical protein RSG52_12030 [Terrisporobacter sp.]
MIILKIYTAKGEQITSIDNCIVGTQVQFVADEFTKLCKNK